MRDILGTLMNIITVIVLTRPQMISPVNVILCAVALCDISVMSSYFIFVVHFLLSAANRCEPSDYSYLWAWFTMFHAHSSVIFHATSIWLTVGPDTIVLNSHHENSHFLGYISANSGIHYSSSNHGSNQHNYGSKYCNCQFCNLLNYDRRKFTKFFNF